MTLGGWKTPQRGWLGSSVFGRAELQCRARRRQTSVRATRLRFYATLYLYPCLLAPLSTSLYAPLPPTRLSPSLPRYLPLQSSYYTARTLFVASISSTFATFHTGSIFELSRELWDFSCRARSVIDVSNTAVLGYELLGGAKVSRVRY